MRCDFEYNAAPQFPFRTSVFVQPGKQALSPFRATRLWFAVVVDVTCVASAGMRQSSGRVHARPTVLRKNQA